MLDPPRRHNADAQAMQRARESSGEKLRGVATASLQATAWCWSPGNMASLWKNRIVSKDLYDFHGLVTYMDLYVSFFLWDLPKTVTFVIFVIDFSEH